MTGLQPVSPCGKLKDLSRPLLQIAAQGRSTKAGRKIKWWFAIYAMSFIALCMVARRLTSHEVDILELANAKRAAEGAELRADEEERARSEVERSAVLEARGERCGESDNSGDVRGRAARRRSSHRGACKQDEIAKAWRSTEWKSKRLKNDVYCGGV
jgi:hypothetical protein